jgi:hypothetical protein
MDTATYKSSVPDPKKGHLSSTFSAVAPHCSALFYPNRAQLLFDEDDIVIQQLLAFVVVSHVDVTCLNHILDVLCCTVCGRLVSEGRLIFKIWGQVLDGNRSHQLTLTVVTTRRQL